jgi:hypothetical protein
MGLGFWFCLRQPLNPKGGCFCQLSKLAVSVVDPSQRKGSLLILALTRVQIVEGQGLVS